MRPNYSFWYNKTQFHHDLYSTLLQNAVIIMGADYSKELESSWNNEDVREWKKKALEILKSYYLGFSGTQWHEFDRSKDTDLLRAKICYALFGPPTEEVERIEDAYSTEQKDKAKALMDVILKVG